jgi:hypothetical protein
MRPPNRSLLYILCCAYVLSLASSSFAQTREPGANPSLSETRVGDGAAPVTQLHDSPGMTTASAELPDSPGTEWARSQESSSQQGQTSSAGSQQEAQAPSGQEPKAQRPVGTAAAEAPKVSGVTAAQPAGIAIAPAKQHRTRAIVIKVGAIVGGGVALGTVIGLSAATHSKPPGAH